jgi:2-deoxy-D-gluconate 3-dehydrogenase
MSRAGVLDTFQLHNRVAIVTGASRGLGAAMALALAEAGADLVLVARGDTAALAAVIRTLGRRCLAVTADVADKDAAASVVSDTYAGFGRADILVNNAGIIRRAGVLEFSDGDWSDVLRTNLDGAFRLSQRFAAEAVARQRPAKIVNIASMLSFQGGVRVVSYTAAKSALAGLTRAMANELAAANINVNAIAPGYMATDNTVALRSDPARNRAILERIPAGRWGAASDLAGAVVFLASPASDYVHGVTLPVDGGWLAR